MALYLQQVYIAPNEVKDDYVRLITKNGEEGRRSLLQVLF
jgi:hypothetical protein